MSRQIIVLDVREMLKNKEEPFAKIMEAIEALGEQDVFELHATFRPEPLIRVLGKRGLRSTVMKIDNEYFVVQFYRTNVELPFFHLDNRGLEPPKPMIRTLDFLEKNEDCKVGNLGLEIWNERVPAFLLPELDDLGFDYEYEDEGGGTVRIQITTKSSGGR